MLELEKKLVFFEKAEKALENAKLKNQHIRKKLIVELIAAFTKLEEPCPEIAILSLKGSYSHKLLKSTLGQLGYASTSKAPDLKKLRVKRQF